MGFGDKLLTGGGVALLGALGVWAIKDARETQRRRSTPMGFDEGLSHQQFCDIVQTAAKATPRVRSAVIESALVTIQVKSSSGLTTWSADVDYNDYGRLTGRYWIYTENDQSLIPRHFADLVTARLREATAGGS